MDARRASRMVIDPKVRQVGFVTPGTPRGRPQSGLSESSSPPVGNSLSPVMIPPPRYASDNLLSPLGIHHSSCALPVTLPMSPRRWPSTGDGVPLGSYNPSESLLGTSLSPSSRIDDRDFSENLSSAGWIGRGNPGKVASSLPSGGFDRTPVKSSNFPRASNLTTVSVVKMPLGLSEV